jgi:hypothetical protein
VEPECDLNLAGPEKLETLRRLDHYRRWHSLDEKRYCLGCERIVSGHEIRVVGAEADPSSARLACPTDNCRSIVMDWVLLPNDFQARISKSVRENLAPPPSVTTVSGERARAPGAWHRLTRHFRASREQ